MESGGDPNEAETPGNSDTIEDLTAYIQEVTNVSGQEVRGVFKVGGFIAQDTTDICDGFAFVRLTSDSLLESLVAKIAAGLALLSLLLLLTLLFRRGGDTDVDFTGDGPGAGDLDSAAVSAGAGGAAAGGAAATGAPSEPEPGPEPEIAPGAGAGDEGGPEPGEEDPRRPDNLA